MDETCPYSSKGVGPRGSYIQKKVDLWTNYSSEENIVNNNQAYPPCIPPHPALYPPPQHPGPITIKYVMTRGTYVQNKADSWTNFTSKNSDPFLETLDPR